MNPARSARRVIRSARSDGPVAATRVLRHGVSWRWRRVARRVRQRPLPVVSSPAGRPAAESDGHLELYTDQRIESDAKLVERVRTALIEHHFCKQTGWTDDHGPERFKVDLD